MALMKAVRIHQYGGPQVLKYEDAPRPEPGAGEVLLRVRAAGVNPADWKVRAGFEKEYLKHRLPLIPGWDVAGVVEATGSGVTRWRHGDKVYGRPDLARDGSYCEFMCVRETELARKPHSLEFSRAAAVPTGALTAWQSLFDSAGLARGQTVLVHAAAGGVGHFAVQLAKWKGAHVVATASARNAPLVRELGAAEVIDYAARRFEDAVRGVDVVLDTVGGDVQQRSWKVLKPGGILISTVKPPSAEEAAHHKARAAFPVTQTDAAQLSEIARLVDYGRLRPVVQIVLQLAAARRAHELSQSGHARGKIVLRVP